jgi:hypothetical protein
MNSKSRLLLPLAVSLAALQACSTVDSRSDDTQAAARVDTVKPVTIPVGTEAPVSAATPVAPPAALAVVNDEAKPDAATATEVAKPAPAVDRYTVKPGDTLATIAGQREIYGDARLWPLLYRANAQQIGPRGLIFPNQVLVVARNQTAEELKALTAGTKRTVPQATAAKPSVATPTAVVAPTPTAAQAPATGAAALVDQSAEANLAEKPLGAPAVATRAIAPAGEAPQGSPAAGASQAKLADYLSGARQAFAAGDSPWSIYYYSVYLEHKVDDADAWGELGNVQYLDGNLPEAAKAYYNAANLLIDRGQTAHAVQLIDAIEEGAPNLAEALHQRLTTIKQ